jgi:hypothetical protein
MRDINHHPTGDVDMIPGTEVMLESTHPDEIE